MDRSRLTKAHIALLAFATMIFALWGGGVVSASAALPFEFDAELSLTGECAVTAFDPVLDPGCPYPVPPNGPSGRFEDPRSVTTDFYGNVYVASYSGGASNGRIDVFDDDGFFVTEFANGDDPKSLAVDSEGNVYAFEEKEVVRYAPSVYEPEAGNIEYASAGVAITATSLAIIGGLAIDRSNDHLFLTENAKVREFNSAAEGNGLLNTIEDPNQNWGTWVAVDAERRRLYVSFCENGQADCGTLVLEADAPHAVLAAVDGSETGVGSFRSQKGWLSIAVNEDNGHFFVEDLESTKNVYEFDANFELASTLSFSGFQGGNALQIGFANTPADPEARNSGYLFVPGLPSREAAFAFRPPEVQPPEINELAAASVAESEATLEATISPNGDETEYLIEYVTQAGFESTGFESAQVAAEGTVPNGLPRRVSIHLTGLASGGSYRFRVSAENEAGPDADEASFATYSDAPVGGGCPNQALRTGLSAHLPDCRAYELVTPPDTNGHPTTGIGFVGDRFTTLQASPSGSAVSFLVVGGVLPGFEGTGGFNGDPYLATRGAGGWGTSAVGPTGFEATAMHPGSFSPDQGFRFWKAIFGSSAGADTVTLVRYPEGHSELVGRGALGTDPRARGKLIATGGTHIVFATENVSPNVAQQLEPNAPPTGTAAVYDRTPDEVTHVVSLLPGNATPAAGQNATYMAASPDGNGIAFKIGTTLYLRLNNSETHEIGEGVELAGVSEGGERVFYLDGGDLYAYDTGSEAVIPFGASGDATVVNVSTDGSRAYFVSPSVLTPGPNPNGATAQAGEQNLYLSEEGAISFVGMVTDRDVEGTETSEAISYDGLGLWTEVFATQPGRAPSRLSPDGSVLLFQSRADLTGFDPEGAPQVYRYDKAAASLRCLSCVATGTPEGGGEGASLLTQAFNYLKEPPLSPYGFTPNLSPDGRRAFFESTEALVSYDTDGKRDVYEWEAQGVGSCTQAGGCLYLISSPRSERDEYLFGQSQSGDDVFFVSGDVLTAADAGGTPSVYDARVGGGFAEGPPAPCSGEGCKSGLSPPPPLVAPESGARSASGNVTPHKAKQCAKNKRKVKRKGKVRCVPKKHKTKSAKGKKRAKGAGKGKGARR